MRRGLTVIELLAALTIMGILALFSFAPVLHRAPKYRLDRATWDLLTRLSFARFRAIRQGYPVRVRFSPSGYTIEAYDEGRDEWRPETAGAVEGVWIQANNTPTFHPAGTVSNFATILVSNSWGTNRITLAITGRTKVTEL